MANPPGIKKILPVIIIIITIAGFLYINSLNNADKLPYSGVVEATTYNLGFEMPGKIQQIATREGNHVKKGDLLARLNDAELLANLKQSESALEASSAELANLLAGARPKEIAQAKAQLAKAQARLRQLINGPTPQELSQAKARMLADREQYLMATRGGRTEDVKSARSRLEAAGSSLDTARQDYKRYKNLYDKGAVSAQRYESFRNQYNQAMSGYTSARQQLRKVKAGPRTEEIKAAYQRYRASQAQYQDMADGTRVEVTDQARADVKYWKNQVGLMIEGPRKNQVKAAQKRVKQAEAVVEAVKVKLANSRILSPADGVVITKNFEEKEVVGAGAPVITMADLAHPWVYIFVPEPKFVKLGMKAKISVDSLPGRKFDGEVVRIYEQAEFTPKFIQTRRERVNLVFRVKVAVDNPALDLKPGMPADVELEKSE